MSRKYNITELCQYIDNNNNNYKIALVLNDFEELCNTLSTYTPKKSDQRKITRNRFNRITKIMLNEGDIIIYKVYSKTDLINGQNIFHIIKIIDYFVSNNNLIKLLIDKIAIHNSNLPNNLEIYNYISILNIIVNNFYTTEKLLLNQIKQNNNINQNIKLLLRLKRNNKLIIRKNIHKKNMSNTDNANIYQENNKDIYILIILIFSLIFYGFIYFYINN